MRGKLETHSFAKQNKMKGKTKQNERQNKTKQNESQAGNSLIGKTSIAVARFDSASSPR